MNFVEMQDIFNPYQYLLIGLGHAGALAYMYIRVYIKIKLFNFRVNF